MSSGADLFVVCKQCGSEVSPYVTECPYCGNRLRRRAPKLPRVNAPSPPSKRQATAGRFARTGVRKTRKATVRASSDRWVATRPYATIAIVATACVMWVAGHAEPMLYTHLLVLGPVGGEWWRLLSTQFLYLEGGGAGMYAFVALLTTGLFGWLVERRHGPAVVAALFLGAGVAGALAATAAYAQPVVVGGNAGALALLCAWAAPDLDALRNGDYREGDLLGAAAFAALLLVIPYARTEVSWLAGVVGAAVGLLVGFGLTRFARAEA